MAVFRRDRARRSWQPVEDAEAPEGLAGAEVGLYEAMRATPSAYALSLHAERIAQSWQRLTGRPFPAVTVPPLADACAEVIRLGWPALRYEVRGFVDGEPVVQIRRRDRPSLVPPVRLLPIDLDASDSAYPHKSVERAHLTRALARAVAAGADDALFVVGGEVRETAQAFIGFVTADAFVLPPLREDVLPSTTRVAASTWCREHGRIVLERPIAMRDLGDGALVYGNAVIGLLPALALGHAAVPLPSWFDTVAIETRLSAVSPPGDPPAS
jgi:branched-subunit amino acid aminotransferase/4-amino-4-deoxychorismate lyase